MLENASSSIRELVVACRSQAILGKQDQALSHLDNALKGVRTSTTLDRLMLLMAKVEILFLDCHEKEALKLFIEEIDDLIVNVPERVAIAVSYNRSDVAMAMLEPDDFYGNFDRSRIANVELWGYRTLYGANEATAAGKHYDSLPAIWEELLRAYRQGCWRPYRAAARLMANECLKLGWPQEAVYHAIIAGQKETAQHVGEWLLVNGYPHNLESSVSALLACTNLQRHFVIGCEITIQMVDVIPNKQLDDVVQWLLPRASIVPHTISDGNILKQAWKVLVAISPRVNQAQAQVIANTATTHEAWKMKPNQRGVTVREDMIKALSQCVNKLSKHEIEKLVEETLPLVLNRKQDHDYSDAVNLLCHLADCGGNEIKVNIRERMYPKGQPLNRVLLQVATFFDVELEKADLLVKGALSIAQNIRLQVQRVPSDRSITMITGSFGYRAVDLGNEKLYVHMISTEDLEAIIRHRHKLTEEALNSVLDSVIEMIVERENLISNKIGLIQTLDDIGDVCDEQRAAKLFGVLSPLALGEIVEPEHGMSAVEAANPLNPFKMGSGKPGELRGVALYVLACIERDIPGIYGKKLDKLIEIGLTEVDPDVRSLAYAAAREKPTLSESEFTALILGTRDSIAEAAHAAFDAIAKKSEFELKRPQWRLLIHSIRIAARSRDVILRRAAAYTCSQIIETIPNGVLKKDLTELRDTFMSDTCFSVRKSAELPNE